MSKYVIHACPQRMWYVEEFLVPSMRDQGIENIRVACDDKGLGNLESCMQIFKSMSGDGGAWHMQDDVIICRDFKERTERLEGQGIVCGFVTAVDGHHGYDGVSSPLTMWWSFPCIYIPNYLARDCASWCYTKARHDPRFVGYTKENKYDDAIFRESLLAMHKDVPVYNLRPNLVDHIDYLIGGTTINQGRNTTINRAMYFKDTDLVDNLEKVLEERRK